MRTRLARFTFLILLFTSQVCSETAELRWLVQIPTAGVLSHGTQSIDVRGSNDKGFLAEFELGLWRRLLVGASFGGQQLIGGEEATWNPEPGLSIRIRLLNETYSRPALAVGFRSQGYGVYDDALSRYAVKSLGIYGVFSRNYSHALGQGGIHFGVNRSLEDEDGDQTISGFVGTDMEFYGHLVLLADYQLGFNDDDALARGRGRGYLNLGGRVNLMEGLFVEFGLRDLLGNGEFSSGVGKTVRVALLR